MDIPGVQILICIFLIAGAAFAGCTGQEEPEVILPPSVEAVTVSAGIVGPESIYAGTLVEVTGSVKGDVSNSPLRITVRQAAGETPGLTDYVSVKDGQFSDFINTTGYAEGLYFVHLEHPTRVSATASFTVARPALTLILNGGRDEVITGESLNVFGMVTRDLDEVKLRVTEAGSGHTLRTYDLPVADGIYHTLIDTRGYSPGDYLLTVSIPEGSVSRPLVIQADTGTIQFTSVPDELVQGETLLISGTVDGRGEYARIEIIRLSDSYLSLSRQVRMTDNRFSTGFGTAGLMPGEYQAVATLQNGASDETGFVILAP